VDYLPFRSCNRCEVVWHCSETCEAENQAAHKHECTGYADDRRWMYMSGLTAGQEQAQR
jgi:hypothetical protein